MGVGSVCHTLNPPLTPAQLASMRASVEARVLLVSPDLLPLARDAGANLSALRHILLLDSEAGQGDAEAFDPLIAAAPRDSRWGDFDEITPSGLCFTSGSTGAPKGVTYTHRGCYLHTMRQLQIGRASCRESVCQSV